MIPIPAFGSWATEAVYPVGSNPWNSNPTKIAPATDLLTPATTWPAQYGNFMFNAIAGDLVAGVANSVALALNNWGAVVPKANIGANISIIFPAGTGVLYDQSVGEWLVHIELVGGSGSNIQFGVTYDAGKSNWVGPFGAVTTALAAVATDGAGHMIQAYPDAAGVTPDALQWVNTLTFSTINSTGVPGGAPFTNAAASWHPAAAQFVVVALNVSGTAYTGIGYSSSATGPTITSNTLPGVWASGTTHGPVMTAATSSDGTKVLFGLGGTAGSADLSRLMVVTFVSSALVFTDVTPTILTAGVSVIRTVFDAFTQLWGILTYDGTTSKLYTSPDLSFWTLKTSWSVAVDDIAVVGPVWCASVPNVVSGTTYHRLSLCRNISSASFALAPVVLETGTTQVSLASSGSQLACVTGGGSSIQFSAKAGFDA